MADGCAKRSQRTADRRPTFACDEQHHVRRNIKKTMISRARLKMDHTLLINLYEGLRSVRVALGELIRLRRDIGRAG